MTEIETLRKLNEIQSKIQKKGFLPKGDILFFNDWAITDYIFSPYHSGTIEIEGITFLSSSLPAGTKLCYLRHEKNNKMSDFCIKTSVIESIPEKEMRSPLISMGTIFAYLPNNLNDYQMRRIAHEETLLSYAAPYIIRGAWGKKLCSFPRVDNRIRPEFNAYSEQWLKIYNLCVKCRDLLTNTELEKLPRAWDWLRLIVHEHRKIFFDFLCSSEARQNISKVETASELRQYASALADGVNPCDPEAEPHRHRLMQVCIGIADKADVFRKELWNPYLSSVRNWANVAENSTNVLAVSCSDSGEVKRQRQGTGAKVAK